MRAKLPIALTAQECDASKAAQRATAGTNHTKCIVFYIHSPEAKTINKKMPPVSQGHLYRSQV